MLFCTRGILFLPFCCFHRSQGRLAIKQEYFTILLRLQGLLLVLLLHSEKPCNKTKPLFDSPPGPAPGVGAAWWPSWCYHCTRPAHHKPCVGYGLPAVGVQAHYAPSVTHQLLWSWSSLGCEAYHCFLLGCFASYLKMFTLQAGAKHSNPPHVLDPIHETIVNSIWKLKLFKGSLFWW